MDVHPHSSSPKSVLSIWKTDQENTTYGQIRTIQHLKTEFRRDRNIEKKSTRIKDRIEKKINSPTVKSGGKPYK